MHRQNFLPQKHLFPRILPAGDQALSVEFGNEIRTEINGKVQQLHHFLKEAKFPYIRESVPAFCALLIYYDPMQISFAGLRRKISSFLKKLPENASNEKRVVEIPVCYGGSCGPDLSYVAAHAGISEEEVIRRHTQREYLIYMLGFQPGFPYLGGLDETLFTPRLQTPRTLIPAGSVGIGGQQTGIYPSDSPGGWQLIGRTPLAVAVYDSRRETPFLYKSGDYIRFYSITEAEYAKMQENDGKPEDDAGNHANADVREELHIISPGALSSIQDTGRFGAMELGFTSAGAADGRALRAANLLAGNKPDAAAIECTLIGPEIVFLEETAFAITGADMSPVLNGKPVPLYERIVGKAGDRLKLSGAKTGCRSYLAFQGGIEVPEVLGSRSTDFKGKVGGLCGRALRAGDRLVLGQCFSAAKKNTVSKTASETALSTKERSFLESAPQPGQITVLRAVLGPQEDSFSKENREFFCRNLYTVSSDSNRMACRLQGQAVTAEGGSDIISDGIALGSIQISSDGMPIVMLADRQTTGGYAKIGTVISADIPLLAQCKPGDSVRFRFISVREAQRIYRKEQKKFAGLEKRLLKKG